MALFSRIWPFFKGHLALCKSLPTLVSRLVIIALVWVFILPLYALPSCSKFSASLLFLSCYLHYFACVMPRLTRNSRESGPVVSGVVNVSSEQASSESRTSIGATTGASTTTNTVVQSGTSTMPTLSTGDIVTNVVQVLQGQLTGTECH